MTRIIAEDVPRKAALEATMNRDAIAVALLVCLVVVAGSITLSRNELYRKAYDLWSDTVRKSPAKARPHFNLGTIYERTNRLDAALSEYRIAVGIDPDYHEARNNIANVYLKQGRVDDAFYAFQAAIAAKPEASSLSHDNLGFIFFSKGQYDDAIREYRTALKLDPRSAAIRNNLGYVYLTLGRFDEAAQEFEAALERDPALDVARQNLTIAVQRQQRITGGVKH